MDYLFLIFVTLLGLAGLAFFGMFVYRLDRTPEMGRPMRQFNRGLVGLGLCGLVAGLALAIFTAAPLADWGLVLGLGLLAFVMLLVAAQGFGVGFQQMEEDGIGFLRFFQLGSAIVVCMAFAPAFVAFITYSTRLR